MLTQLSRLYMTAILIPSTTLCRPPVVGIAHVVCLESAAFQLERHDDVAEVERHDLGVDMPSIGQELLGRRLAPGDLERHRVGSEEPRHHGRSPCGACRRAGAASSCFRPKRPGYGYRAWCGPTEKADENH